MASKLAGYTLRYPNIAMEKRMYFLWKMVIFHCYVSLPEGNSLIAIERHVFAMVLFSEGEGQFDIWSVKDVFINLAFCTHPICSMYGMFTYIIQPNVCKYICKYTIHASHGHVSVYL